MDRILGCDQSSELLLQTPGDGLGVAAHGSLDMKKGSNGGAPLDALVRAAFPWTASGANPSGLPLSGEPPLGPLSFPCPWGACCAVLRSHSL